MDSTSESRVEHPALVIESHGANCRIQHRDVQDVTFAADLSLDHLELNDVEPAALRPGERLARKEPSGLSFFRAKRGLEDESVAESYSTEAFRKRRRIDESSENPGQPRRVSLLMNDVDPMDLEPPNSGSVNALPTRLLRGTRQLPAEIWQHIFLYLAPQALGRLLAVNRLFCYLLHPRLSAAWDLPLLASDMPSSGPKTRMAPDTIWQISRRRTYPSMPAPLVGNTELDM